MGPEQSLSILSSQLEGVNWDGTGIGYGVRGSRREDLTIRLEGMYGTSRVAFYFVVYAARNAAHGRAAVVRLQVFSTLPQILSKPTVPRRQKHLSFSTTLRPPDYGPSRDVSHFLPPLETARTHRDRIL